MTTTKTDLTANETSALIEELTARPIAFQPIYKKLTGSFSSAILLSQIMYWRNAMNRAFYKTDAEFSDELCMTAKEFRTAKEHLKAVPFLKIFRAGAMGKCHYDINYDLFVSSMKHCVLFLNSPNGRIAQTGITGPAQMGETEASSYAQMGETLTETTLQRLQTETNKVADAPDLKRNKTNPKPSSPKKKKPAGPPTIDAVKKWAGEWADKHNKNKTSVTICAEEAFKYYERMEWRDRNNKKVLNWKNKIAGVWLSDEKLSSVKIKKQEYRI